MPRTLVDLAEVLTEDQLSRACHEAGVLYETTPKHIQAVLERRPNSPGARTLQEVLGLRIPVTLSDLEEAFLKLLRENGLPLPITNRRADRRRVDCRWPEYRLTVELDSYKFHNSRYAWERDRQGEREARKRRDAFRRFTYGDVIADPGYVLGELRGLLGPDLHGNPVQR